MRQYLHFCSILFLTEEGPKIVGLMINFISNCFQEIIDKFDTPLRIMYKYVLLLYKLRLNP